MKKLALLCICIFAVIDGIQAQSDQHDHHANHPKSVTTSIPDGTYYVDPHSTSLNDSLTFKGDSLTVYKKSSYGYGALLSFTYTLNHLPDGRIHVEAAYYETNGKRIDSDASIFSLHGTTLTIESPTEHEWIIFGTNNTDTLRLLETRGQVHLHKHTHTH